MIKLNNKEEWTPSPHWLSATTVTKFMQCPRLGMIDSYWRHNGAYTSYHAEYGRAAGAALAAIVEHWEKGTFARQKAALAAALANKEFPVDAEVGSKNWMSLWSSVIIFEDQWKKQHKEGWRFVSMETHRVLHVIDEDGQEVAHLSGSQDLLVCNINTKRYKVIDFKSIKTAFFYSFEYDMQTTRYMLMDAILHEDRTYEPPEFWVFEVDVDKLQLTVFTTKHSCISNLLPGEPDAWETAMKYGENNEVHPHEIPGNIHTCKHGNFPCFRHDICHEGMPINCSEPREEYEGEDLEHIHISRENLKACVGSLADRVLDLYGTACDVDEEALFEDMTEFSVDDLNLDEDLLL